MTTIFKYPLEIVGYQIVKMPEEASILCVQNQGGTICIWAEVSTENKLEDREIEIFGTGHNMPLDSRIYIGTVQEGPFVWHVWER